MKKGCIERWHRTLRDQLLDELSSGPHSLERLNAALWAWLEREYHARTHSTTGRAPGLHIEAELEHLRPVPKDIDLRDVFLHRTRRLVHKDGCVRFQGQRYEVPGDLVGEHVELRHDPRVPEDRPLVFLRGAYRDVATLLDRVANASGARKRLPAQEPTPEGLDLDVLAQLEAEHYRTVYGSAGESEDENEDDADEGEPVADDDTATDLEDDADAGEPVADDDTATEDLGDDDSPSRTCRCPATPAARPSTTKATTSPASLASSAGCPALQVGHGAPPRSPGVRSMSTSSRSSPTGTAGSPRSSMVIVMLMSSPSSGHLCAQLSRPRHRVLYLCDSTLSPTGIYRALAGELGLRPHHRRGQLWTDLKRVLQRLVDDEEIQPVLVLDEAHLLSEDFLQELAAFLNFDFDSRDLLTLWLVGLPALHRRLQMQHHASLAMRVVAPCVLHRRDRTAFVAMIEHACRTAGATHNLLSDPAMELLFRASRGLPRLAAKLLHAALRVLDQLEWDTPRPGRRSRGKESP